MLVDPGPATSLDTLEHELTTRGASLADAPAGFDEWMKAATTELEDAVLLASGYRICQTLDLDRATGTDGQRLRLS